MVKSERVISESPLLYPRPTQSILNMASRPVVNPALGKNLFPIFNYLNLILQQPKTVSNPQRPTTTASPLPPRFHCRPLLSLDILSSTLSPNWLYPSLIIILFTIPPSAGCCTVLSIFGILILSVFGYGFTHNWEALMGSEEDPKDGAAVGTTCYIAALIYAAFVAFCGCQLGVHRRYSRI